MGLRQGKAVRLLAILDEIATRDFLDASQK